MSLPSSPCSPPLPCYFYGELLTPQIVDAEDFISNFTITKDFSIMSVLSSPCSPPLPCYFYGELLTPQIVNAEDFISNFTILTSSNDDITFDGLTFTIKNPGFYKFDINYHCEDSSMFSLYDVDEKVSVPGTYIGTILTTEEEIGNKNNNNNGIRLRNESDESGGNDNRNYFFSSDCKNCKNKEAENLNDCDDENDENDDCLTSDYENDDKDDDDNNFTNVDFDNIPSGSFKKVNPGINIVNHNVIITLSKRETKYRIKNNLDTSVRLINTSGNNTPVAKVLFYKIE